MTNTMTLGRKALLILTMAVSALALTLSPLAPAQPASAGHVGQNTAVCLYQHENYGGWAFCIQEYPGPGQGDVANLAEYGLDDQASGITASVRASGWYTTGYLGLFVYPWCTAGQGGWAFGNGLHGYGDWYIASLVPYGWNDMISSICF